MSAQSKKKGTRQSKATVGTANKKRGQSSADGNPEKKSKGQQISAIVLFTSALLILAVLLVEGSRAWNSLHLFIFGITGAAAYSLPVVLCYIAVMLALDKTDGKIKSNIISASVLIVLLCGAIEVFAHPPAADKDFIAYVTQAYSSGKAVAGGGFFGSLISYPLFALFGVVPARITLLLALFATLMITTGTTLRTLGSAALKPISRVREKRQEHARRKAEPRFNIDVPIGEMPEHPVESNPKRFSHTDEDDEDDTIEDKRKKLIDTYTGAPASEPSKTDEKTTKSEKKKKSKPSEPPQSSGVVIEPESSYKYPPIELLNASKNADTNLVEAEIKANCDHLVNILLSFGVEVRVTGYSRGPSVTRYEIQLSVGVRINKITNLADDIALQLRAPSVRISPIPNKSAIGIEVPNTNSSIVGMRDIIESAEYMNSKSKLTATLGKDVTGNIAVCDLAKMPHLLVAGTTGSGKSVCLNAMILSMLYKANPDEVKFVMIDPKDVEFRVYNGIPHLLVPVVSDPHKAAGALGWAVVEMEKRYKILAENGVRNLSSYNEMCRKNPEMKPMPQIVIIIDEFADLMMVAGNEVESSVCRIAQKARAAGMHLVIATQRPSADIFTGLIKSNIPSRIALSVSSQVNSQIILDMGGAEKLMGKGDMLYFPVGFSKPLRVQGCFVSDKEISSVTDFIRKSGEENEYDQSVITEIEKQAQDTKKGGKSSRDYDDADGDSDERLSDAIEVVVEAGIASTSLLQRKLKLGYARAARIVDMLEERGIVGPFEGSKPRKVLITRQQWLEMQTRGEGEYTSGTASELDNEEDD